MNKYIDADKFYKLLTSSCKENSVDLDTVYNLLSEMPSIDILEVVKCKDCKHNYIASLNDANALCNLFYGCWQADDYCSHAEKR